MIVTPFALIILLLGILALVRGTPLTMFSLFLVSTLFGGSAALILVAAGGSSIPPAQFLLFFLALRLLLPGPGQMHSLSRAVWQNRYLVAFVLYGVISAFILPVIFARTMSVTPLKAIPGADLFAVLPLRLSPQNFTTAFYLVGTMLAGVTATAAMQRPGAAERLVKLGPIITLVHAGLGISGALLINTPWNNVLALFRNGNYAQLNQSFGGLVRINGIWPETSSFAAYGSAWCVLMFELWFRDIAPRRTGISGLVMLLALIASTSSSAYVSLTVYGLFIAVRFALRPRGMTVRKQLALIASALVAAVVTVGAFVLMPGFAHKFSNILALMTIEKSGSGSGIQRAFWAKQGVEVFMKSYGLGIGPGSFRSSSVLTAILGSMGVIGAITFVAHLLRSVQPFEAEFLSLRNTSLERTVGCAASSTALVMLAPAMVGSPSPDPGVLWAVMCGIAIALRPRAERRLQPMVQRRAATA